MIKNDKKANCCFDTNRPYFYPFALVNCFDVHILNYKADYLIKGINPIRLQQLRYHFVPLPIEIINNT